MRSVCHTCVSWSGADLTKLSPVTGAKERPDCEARCWAEHQILGRLGIFAGNVLEVGTHGLEVPQRGI